MQAYIDQISLFIEANQAWAGLIVFLLTLGESMLIVGIMIPATALLLFTGGLVGAGTLPAAPILLVGDCGRHRWRCGFVLARSAHWPDDLALAYCQTASNHGCTGAPVLLSLRLSVDLFWAFSGSDTQHHPDRGWRHGHVALAIPTG